MNQAIATLISASLLSCLTISPVFAGVATLQFDYDSPQDSGKIQAQGVQAVLSYDKNINESGDIEYVPNLTVSAGTQVFKTTGESSFSKYSMVQIAEMDPSNPFPEVIFSSFTGGAHCCTVVQIITSNAKGSQWQMVDAGMFNSGMNEVSDSDKNGVYEYVTNDDRFLYQFSSYAASFPPIQILQLSGLEMLDISKERRFFPLHRQRLQDIWQTIDEVGKSKDDYEINGLLAGYVATKVILGETIPGWELMLKRYDQSSKWGLEECNGEYNDQGECLGGMITYDSFPAALRAFLISNSYLQK